MSHKPSIPWSARTDPETVAKRAAGRRRYNAVRQFKRELRRRQIVKLAVAERLRATERGFQVQMARRLGVSPSTICRDMKAIWTEARRCPVCGAPAVRRA